MNVPKISYSSKYSNSVSGENLPVSHLSNTWVNKQNRTTIDTISFTGNFTDIPSPSDCFTDEDNLNYLSALLASAVGFKGSGIDSPSINYYSKHQKLSYADDRPRKNLGFIAWGGNKGTYQFFLTGEACEYLYITHGWGKLYKIAEDFLLRITRVDIAYDDYLGKADLNYALDQYDKGNFSITRNPKITMVGDWRNSFDPKGRTVYIGSRSSCKYLRVYEKGKELGRENDPWVRWEVEFKADKRYIPLQIMFDCDSYFAGAYPVLSRFGFSEVVNVLSTVKKKAKVAVEKTIENIKNSYGQAINSLRALYGDKRLLDLLSRSGVPKRLILPIPTLAACKSITRPFYYRTPSFDPIAFSMLN